MDVSRPASCRPRRPHPVAWIAVAVALVLPLAACGYDRTHLRAAHDLQCASDKVDEIQIDDSRKRYTGCGRKITYFCSMDSHGTPYCEREKPNPRAEVQQAFAKAFACPYYLVKVDDVDAKTFHAKACDKEGVFVCTDSDGAFECAPKSVPAPPGSSVPPGAPAKAVAGG